MKIVARAEWPYWEHALLSFEERPMAYRIAGIDVNKNRTGRMRRHSRLARVSSFFLVVP
jgi:hypothetical protein